MNADDADDAAAFGGGGGGGGGGGRRCGSIARNASARVRLPRRDRTRVDE